MSVEIRSGNCEEIVGVTAIPAGKKKRHQQGEADAELERIRQDVKRKELGLLGMIGLTRDDLAA